MYEFTWETGGSPKSIRVVADTLAEAHRKALVEPSRSPLWSDSGLLEWLRRREPTIRRLNNRRAD